MILNHVPQSPRALIISRSILNAELFTCSDLYMVDVSFIPEMLEKGIRETQDHDVLSRFFAQKMVDPERARFVEAFLHRIVKMPGGG